MVQLKDLRAIDGLGTFFCLGGASAKPAIPGGGGGPGAPGGGGGGGGPIPGGGGGGGATIHYIKLYTIIYNYTQQYKYIGTSINNSKLVAQENSLVFQN